MNIRFNGVRKNEPAIVSKENILPLPFKGILNTNYPEKLLTVSYDELGSSLKH